MRRLAVAFAPLVVTALGCVDGVSPNETDTASSAPAAGAIDEVLVGTCQSPRRYIAVVAEGECAEVLAPRGRWVPERLFVDAPEGSGTCFYTWSGKPGPVDADALAILERYVGPAGALTASACGSEELEAAALVEVPSRRLDPGVGGSVGCDVCGLQRNGRVWAVLPPEKVSLRELHVRLSDGSTRSFRIEASDRTRRVTLNLPPPLRGTWYLNGRATLR